VLNWIKKIFGAGEEKTQKLSDHVAKKKPLILVPSKAELKKETKVKLEQMGRKHGIELDRRLTKDKLVNELHKHMKSLNK
jgi:hypothetical protein